MLRFINESLGREAQVAAIADNIIERLNGLDRHHCDSIVGSLDSDIIDYLSDNVDNVVDVHDPILHDEILVSVDGKKYPLCLVWMYDTDNGNVEGFYHQMDSGTHLIALFGRMVDESIIEHEVAHLVYRIRKEKRNIRQKSGYYDRTDGEEDEPINRFVYLMRKTE